MSKNPGRTTIIGLDGVPYKLIQSYTEQGIMPNLKRHMADSVFCRMESSIPDVSSVAWSSVITGRNPGEHGIFGFTEIDRESYRYQFPAYTDLKTAPFWGNKKSAIINVPQTYPAPPLNGVLISGFVAPSLENAVFPPELLPELRDIDYRIDVNAELAHQSLHKFMEDAVATLNARMRCFELLWEREPWEIFMFVFTETDRLHHFLFDAYENDAHPFFEAFQDFYRQIDLHIGTIADRIAPTDPLIIHSDHGFCRLEREVYINHFLQEHGFLAFNSPSPRMISDLDPAGTTAFALDPGRIYIHTADHFPRGNVSAKDAENITQELTALFESLQFEGRKVVARILLKQDIFHGPHAQQGPDMVLLGNNGFDLKGVVSAEGLFGKRAFTGMHTQDDAFIVYKGERALEEPFHIEKISALI